MTCLILTGGNMPEKDILDFYLKASDCIIGVDGAADMFLRYGITPNYLIGDFDTADPASVAVLEEKGATVYRLEPEKNETDTEAAIDLAVRKGAKEINMLGALGKRVDHTLSNIMMMVRASQKGAVCRIVDKYSELTVSDYHAIVSGKKGDTLSILPITGELKVTASGLKYPLENLSLNWGSSRGVSNVMLGAEAEINISGGFALIVRTSAKS